MTHLILSAAANAGRITSATILADDERDARNRLQQLLGQDDAALIGGDPQWYVDNGYRMFRGGVKVGGCLVTVTTRCEPIARVA